MSNVWVRLTFGQMYLPQRLVAKCVTILVRLTSGQIYPPQWHLVARCVTTSVRLTSGQTYPPDRDILRPSVLLPWSGWSLVRCTPMAETSCGQVCYYFSWVDLCSDIPPMGRDIIWPNVLLIQSGCPLVRCTPSPGRDILWLSVLLLQTDWPLVRCTHQDEASGQVDISSDCGSCWHLVFPIAFPICDHKSTS